MPVATKKLRSNRAWIERHINDPFVKRSKAEGYRARSVYKLTELDDREHLLRRGMTVVELGAAPGSWTQIVRERLSDKDGRVRPHHSHGYPADGSDRRRDIPAGRFP